MPSALHSSIILAVCAPSTIPPASSSTETSNRFVALSINLTSVARIVIPLFIRSKVPRIEALPSRLSRTSR